VTDPVTLFGILKLHREPDKIIRKIPLDQNDDHPMSLLEFRILLIDFSPAVFSNGVRSIAAYLREKGIHVDTLYLPQDRGSSFGTISDQKLEILHLFSKSFDLIGMSILTHHFFERVNQVSNFLKDKVTVPIIWGGVPVICTPEYFLEFNQFVCLGEGETFLHELSERIIKGISFLDADNLGYRDQKGRIHLNKVAPFVDLKKVPPSIFAVDNCYILRDRPVSFREAPEVLENDTADRGYQIHQIRGCPFSCTYCSNNAVKNKFKNSGKILRYPELEGTLQELEHGMKLVPNMKWVWFNEDDFFAQSRESIEMFCAQYNKRINLPILINATFLNMTPEKIDILIKSGIKFKQIKIGLQSGSQWTNKKIYKRIFRPELIKERLDYVFKNKIRIVIDLISGNPFESDKERCETASFLYELLNEVYYKDKDEIRKYVYIMDHKLMFFPGTELYELALDKNIIGNNYIQEVLLQRAFHRRTDLKEFDAELLAIYAFNNTNWLPSRAILKLLSNLSVYRLLNSNIFKKLFYLLYISRVPRFLRLSRHVS
jgi:anaerobic magnesium-protoporphyrin IX monomethyl ester cyclase